MAETALITGSSRGIGAAVARTLAKAGYQVCINCIERTDLAQALVEELEAQGCRAIWHQADVADRQAVKEMFSHIEKELGPVDLLVNNAGIAWQLQFQDITQEIWDRTFAVNLGGCYNTIQEALPHMLHEHRGCIINMSSIWGQHGASCESSYAATKHAIIGLSRSLAAELAPSGIRVNCVAPGVIDTEMVKVLGDETLDLLCREVIPMGRLGMPQEIADTVLHLVRASYTTGQVLTVDGGFFF